MLLAGHPRVASFSMVGSRALILCTLQSRAHVQQFFVLIDFKAIVSQYIHSQQTIEATPSAQNFRNNSHSIINKPPKAFSSAGLPVTIIADTMKNTMFKYFGRSA